MQPLSGKHLASLWLTFALLAACQAGTLAGPDSTKINPQVSAAAQALARGTSTSARSDAQGRLQVYVYVTDLTPDTLGKLAQAGLADPQSNPGVNVVQGWIAPRDLGTLAALDCVTSITLPRYATPR